jgi:hypothetical protein
MPEYYSPGVYVEEVDSGSRPIQGVGTAVAAFVGLAETGPFNSPTLVSNWLQFTSKFGGFVTGSFLAHSVYGYFMNGGGNCYIVRIGDDDGAGAAAEASPVPQAMLRGYRVLALDAGVSDGEIELEVVEAGGESPTEDMFKLLVKRGGQVVEEYDRATIGRGRQNIATMVRDASKLITIEDARKQGVAAEKPDVGEVATLVAPPPPEALPSPRLTADDYVGEVMDRSGVQGLEAIDDITMVCVPDLMSAYQQGAINLETVQAVQLAMIAHCELMGDRIAVLDAPPGLNAQQVKEWRQDKAGYDSAYASLYWPWISTFDVSTGDQLLLPPSGHLAGIWGRNDDTRGVHKAPANEVVRGAVSLEMQITRKEHDLLNPIGINCIRAFPGRGIRVWGARTLSSDPAWRYLNIRRYFNYLEESILAGTNWVVFEPNDDALWAKIRRTISAFLAMEWRKGALFGLTPDEAFFVKCDRETNPSEAIDAGQVLCMIGVAPVNPAEFVIFRLAQFSGGTSLISE